MPICKNDPTKSYKGNEPSPKGLGYCAHAEEVGKIRKGLDGNKWKINKTSKGIKRWIRYKINNISKNKYENKYENKYKQIQKKVKGYKTYFIHDNFNRPYLVYIKDDVYIYKINKDILKNHIYSKKDKDNIWMYTEFIEHIKPKKIFIGKSPKIKMTTLSGGHGKYFDGNTILLLLNNNNYALIDGNGINRFTTNNDKIIKYYSFVGNNDVPYPIAIGEKYYYFWIYPEGYLEKKEFPSYKKVEDLQNIINKGQEYNPFMYSIKDHKKKSKKITLEQFKEIQEKTLEQIPNSTIKELAKLFEVTTSASSKKELADRIESMRGIKIYKKTK